MLTSPIRPAANAWARAPGPSSGMTTTRSRRPFGTLARVRQGASRGARIVTWPTASRSSLRTTVIAKRRPARSAPRAITTSPGGPSDGAGGWKRSRSTPPGTTWQSRANISDTARRAVSLVAAQTSTRPIARSRSGCTKATPASCSGRWNVITVTPRACRSAARAGLGASGSWMCTTSKGTADSVSSRAEARSIGPPIRRLGPAGRARPSGTTTTSPGPGERGGDVTVAKRAKAPPPVVEEFGAGRGREDAHPVPAACECPGLLLDAPGQIVVGGPRMR